MLKLSTACFFTVALVASATASAKNLKAKKYSSEMPTYHQLMSLSPIDRLNFLTDLRNVMTAARIMSIGNPDGLVTEVEQPRPQDKYAAIMELLFPKASAAGMAWYDGFLDSLPGMNSKMTAPNMYGQTVPSHNWQADGSRDLYTCHGTYDIGNGQQGCNKWDVTHLSADQWNAYKNKPLNTTQDKAATDEIDRQMKANQDDSPSKPSDATLKPTAPAPPALAMTQTDKEANGRHTPGIENYDATDMGKNNQMAQNKPNNQSETAKVCTAPTKAQQDDFHHKGYATTCIYAGNMSRFKDNTNRETGTCDGPNSWCSAGDKPKCDGGEKISCPKGKVICSPYVYGLKDSDAKTPYCTDTGPNATMDCDAKAGKLPDKATDKLAYYNKHYGFLQKKGTAIENGWTEYAQAANGSCQGTRTADEFKAVHCRECTVIKNRLSFLHKAYDDKGLMSTTVPTEADPGSTNSNATTNR